jgi:glycosyltransferase involved in cell wall biosynthesis
VLTVAGTSKGLDVETQQPDQTTNAANPSERIEVSVVIPCLNEANSIAICIDKAVHSFAAAKLAGEVVIADNGSIDGSVDIALSHGARVISVAERGYGAALRAGITNSRGSFIVMGDADDSYDFSDVPRFVEKWREGYDVIMGNRFHGEIKNGAMPWHHRYVGNPGLNGLLNLFFRTGIGDSHCGMRGFTREAFDRMDLRSSGMEFASEFVIKAAQIRARITEVPVILWPDKRGRPPHLRSFPDGWRHLRFMLLYAPNWLFLLPGATLSLLGVVIVFWLLPGPRHLTSRIVLDIHTMVFGMIFTLMGVQIMTIGFFAKVFSYAERFDNNPISLKRLLLHVKLEHGLLVGAALFLIGFIGSAQIAWYWAAAGFGPLSYGLREILLWAMFLFLGVQVIFSSFFLSMLGISRGTYIGDYELKK